MKKQLSALLLLSLCLCAALCACGVGETIVGTWTGGKTIRVLGLGVEDGAETAETWTFTEDGAATVELTLSDGTVTSLEFEYSVTEDTLTLTSGERSVGFLYQVEGDTLTFGSGEYSTVFTRSN